MSDKPELKTDEPKPYLSLVAKFQDKVTDISWSIFSIALLCGFLSIGYEAFVWLKSGEWLHLPLYSVLVWLNIELLTSLQNIEWQGIKTIFLWYLELPLSVGLIVSGAIFGALFYAIFSRKE